MKLSNTITIDGIPRIYSKVCDNGREIWLEKSKLTLYPVVRHGGGPLDALPNYAPAEIRRFTTQAPDLTADFPGTVAKHFEARRRHHEELSYAEYVRRAAAGRVELGPGDYERGRLKILSQSMEQYAKTDDARQLVWQEHGTAELRERHGYAPAGLRTLLEAWIRKERRTTSDAWGQVARLRWVAIYPEPDRVVVYLDGLLESPHVEQAGSSALEGRLAALEVNKSKKALKKCARGGLATCAFANHPEDYRTLMDKVRYFQKCTKTEASAIREALHWFQKNRPNAPQVSPNTVRNYLHGKTGKLMRGNSKRV